MPKNLSFVVSGSLAMHGVHMHKACVHKSGACVRIHMYAYACPRVYVVVFSKNRFILLIKELYFP